MSHNINALERDLNEMILQGKILESFEKFYADDVEMQENNAPPTIGKDANRIREEEYVAAIEAFHSAELLGSGVDGDTSYSEWLTDVTLAGVGRITSVQVARRKWRDGKIVSERFYHS